MNPADNLQFHSETNILEIKNSDGVVYSSAGKVLKKGEHKFTKTTKVRARPRGRIFDEGVETKWTYEVSGSNEPASSVDATTDEDSETNEVEDTPNAPTAGNTPESPGQQMAGLRPRRP